MAQRNRSSASSPPTAANLTVEEIRAGIIKLERRIADLEALNFEGISELTHEANNLATKINSTLRDVFGVNTIEYNDYEVRWSSFVILVMGEQLPRHEKIEAFRSGIDSARSKLRTAIAIMREKLGDATAEDGPGRALRAYEGLDLHREIADAAGDVYRDGHYANSIEDAVKALNDLVRMRSGEALDGTQLMERVFSCTSTILPTRATAMNKRAS